ncbi:hypothetical protein [Spongiibacter sp.]|uniref:hypothetical protein n=1 Tax=Spongiibacter sp. TaxID=2024860 RepID=UPI00356398E7
MNNQNREINVKNLCSRKLWELLKNAEWQNSRERCAIERELSGRRHYIDELKSLENPAPGSLNATETRH